MLFNSFKWIVVVSAISILFAESIHSWARKGGIQAQIRFVASSTFVRGTWGLNEDTYLVELRNSRSGSAFLALLIDTYPNEAPPIPYDVVTANKETAIRVRRNTKCDRQFGDIQLRSAPGDRSTLLPEKLIYKLQISIEPARDAIIPCFYTLR